MKSNNFFFRLLSIPFFYKLSQGILAPKGPMDLQAKMRKLVKQLPKGENFLAVGCGPSSWLWHQDQHPIGLDLNFSYVKAFKAERGESVTGSAETLPFLSSTFDGVWSFGLLHHLPSSIAEKAIKEIYRVTCPGGYCVVFDAVLPEAIWRRPVPWLIRKIDRGRFMRTQEELESLLSQDLDWKCERFIYSLYKLEAIFCILNKI
jgi:SAM-dependent methyltransferase